MRLERGPKDPDQGVINFKNLESFEFLQSSVICICKLPSKKNVKALRDSYYSPFVMNGVHISSEQLFAREGEKQ